MSQPVKLSDGLVLDARLTGEVFQRSIAGQIEFWARLGRTLEDLLDGRHLRMLAQTHSSRPLSELIDTLETVEGQERVTAYLESTPFPHFAQHPEDASLLIRTDEDGQVSIGRFIDRRFVIVDNTSPADTAYVTPTELAVELGTTPKTLRRWLRTLPELEHSRHGRYRWEKSDPFLKDAAVRFQKHRSAEARITHVAASAQ